MPAAETPGVAAPVAQPQPSVARRVRIVIAIAIILLALLIIAFVIWYNWVGRKAGRTGQAAGAQSAASFEKEARRV